MADLTQETVQDEQVQDTTVQQLNEANLLLEEKTNLIALKDSQIADLTARLQQAMLSTNEALHQRLNAVIASLEENTNLLTMKDLRIQHLNNLVTQQEMYCNELVKKQEQIISLNYTLLSRQVNNT